MTKWPKKYVVMEVFLGIVFLFAAVSIYLATPVTPASGPVLELLGSRTALVAYTIWFALMSMALFLGRFHPDLLKKRRIKKNALLAGYLTCIYVVFLEAAYLGMSVVLLDEIFIGILCAFLWVKWKLFTEYK